VERVKLTEFDWIERWEESDRKTWRRIANLFDDWMVNVGEQPRRVTATRGETSLSEDVLPDESDRPVLTRSSASRRDSTLRAGSPGRRRATARARSGLGCSQSGYCRKA
jgi:hypothetical protein